MGIRKKNPPGREEVHEILEPLLILLEEQYGRKPILYATSKSYDLYISGYYSEYPIWIRNVVFEPSLPDGRDWTFWQYSHRQILQGYSGEEKYIDMNVFYGTEEEFQDFIYSE